MRVEAFHFALRLVLMDDGRTFPIDTLYAAGGAITDDPDEAVVFVAGDEEFGWFYGEIGHVERVSVQ